jgi:hypothetical protein
MSHVNFFPEAYNCFNIVKNDQVQDTKIIQVSNLPASVFIIPLIIEIPFSHQQVIDWLIPDINSSSGPTTPSASLRAPPFC